MTTLAPEPQYIVWKPVPGKRPGKVDKLPCDHRTGAVADAHDPAIWTDYATAGAAAARLGGKHGVGFVVTEADPYWFLDIDHCFSDGAWSPLALELCQSFPGCFVEISHSGTALHLIGRGVVPPHGTKNAALGLELYTSGRFCALTMNTASGDMTKEAPPAALAALAARMPPAATPVTSADWTAGPCEGWGGPADDDELIRIARSTVSAASAFGGKASFRDLWDGNAEALGRSYPDTGGRAYGESEADSALAMHLAFWTGKDCERIQRLMERSALRRDKWDRESYIQTTIAKACAVQTSVATRHATPAPPPPLPAGAPATSGLILASDLAAHFDGCVYIEDRYVVATPDGALLKPAQFKVSGRYGGKRFVKSAEGRPTSDAWEAFSENELWQPPFAHTLCFRPEAPPRSIIEAAGQRMLNCYVPIAVPCVAGDASPFLAHVATMLPDGRDRMLLLSWMAAVVQNPGDKYQWAPVIQGCEGNGKSILIETMVQAVGERYSHLPQAADLANKFNAWVDRKLFVGVEEVYVAERRDLLDSMLVLITNRRIEVQSKGKDQIMSDNRANFLCCTNHKDAVPKTRNGRRYAVFFTAQQAVEHLARDGLDGDYFPRLYAWLRGGGYAIATHFLRTMAIPAEMHPGGAMHRAPDTSSTVEAIQASLGRPEQAIMEAVEAGDVGFRGGWVSSTYLAALLEARRIHVAPNQWDSTLAALGWVHHPALPGGRVTSVVSPDGKKPRLWIKKGHIMSLNTMTPAATAKYYEAAQEATREAAA